MKQLCFLAAVINPFIFNHQALFWKVTPTFTIQPITNGKQHVLAYIPSRSVKCLIMGGGQIKFHVDFKTQDLRLLGSTIVQLGSP